MGWIFERQRQGRDPPPPPRPRGTGAFRDDVSSMYCCWLLTRVGLRAAAQELVRNEDSQPPPHLLNHKLSGNRIPSDL